MGAPRYVMVANPDGKRCQAYLRDLIGFWQERGMAPDITLIPWRDIVPRLGQLAGLLADDAPALFRLESPGRDQDVMRLLLEAGDDDAGAWRDRHFAKGELVRPGLLQRGFCRTLHGLRGSLDRRPHLSPLACPLAVAELFDKEATCRRLTAAGLPCPPSLPAPAMPAELLDALRAHRFKTAYVKLNAGSSATGIAVVHPCDEIPWAVTSVVRRGDAFHNTRRLQKIAGPELDATLAFLLREGAFIQEGIPMARIDGQNFDLRAVVLHGSVAFTIFRLSGLPMTNLHLGGRRGPWADCRAQIPTRAWLDALDHCAEAARLYPCAALGVDLVFERGFARHFILEINAFGDFFPGLTDDSGRTIHECEIELTARRFGLIADPCSR
jgi:hypothetical protein